MLALVARLCNYVSTPLITWFQTAYNFLKFYSFLDAVFSNNLAFKRLKNKL